MSCPSANTPEALAEMIAFVYHLKFYAEEGDQRMLEEAWARRWARYTLSTTKPEPSIKWGKGKPLDRTGRTQRN